jgi:hypothetical protein
MTNEEARMITLLERIDSQFSQLGDRVRMLEIWQAWLKGALVALVTPWVHLYRYALGK